VSWLAQVRRPLMATGFALLIGGALGNLIDRVLYGYVVDFIDASALWFPFVFNGADVFINLGVVCLALDFLRNRDAVM
ncbi:MAG: signal peptidase II, partial [Pseudomonadota bacterium]